jgi:alpha-N-acetylglucosaminidase
MKCNSMFLIVGACAAVFLPTAAIHGAETNTVIRGLIERVLPGHTQDFVVETVAAPAGQNVFEVEARGGKIVLRGDSPLSQAVALNWYLKHNALVAVSWYADDPVNAPQALPLPKEKVTRQTKLQQRFFLNYCTFGYSFPWWQWRDWERFIDWLALNGVNLVLTQGASEAVWQQVWRAYGLTDTEIRGAFFSGPAHLPWHRMGNLDKWDGPLPQSYIDGQLALTKRIVARERSFGMKTVLPAFSGHVPEALPRVRPDTKLARLHWCGVSTCFIAPQDPLFGEIQVKFLRAQERELGTDHCYGTDPFNEMNPPSWEPDYLASVSKAIYSSMAQADAEAIWVQMAWTFKDAGWTKPRLQAMINAVPCGRMLLLDYFCENVELWRRHDFFGAPFIWNYLGNFGGNTPVCGPINEVNARLTAVMNDATLTNFSGIGSTLEGLHNQSMYEFLLERAWAGPQCDVKAWLQEQARCHAGGADAAVESGYATFWLESLDGRGDRRNVTSRGDVFMTVPRLASGSARGYLGEAAAVQAAPLAEAWKQMLAAKSEARAHDAYQADLVNITAETLTALAGDARRGMREAYDHKDAAAFKLRSARFLQLGRDLDPLLGTRPNYLMGKWIADARAWGKDPAEADYYERNARTIVTTWFGRNNMLNDYAGRDWNGLLGSYYLGRWQLYLGEMARALESGTAPDPTIDARIADFEWQWARAVGTKLPAKPTGDCYAMSRALYEKYAPLVPVVLGGWTPATTPADFAEMRWQIPAANLKGETLRLRFQYESGTKALEIKGVALKNGHTTLAEDMHPGWTGIATTNSSYTLKLPQGLDAGQVTLTAVARGAGGTDSSGAVILEP